MHIQCRIIWFSCVVVAMRFPLPHNGGPFPLLSLLPVSCWMWIPVSSALIMLHNFFDIRYIYACENGGVGVVANTIQHTPTVFYCMHEKLLHMITYIFQLPRELFPRIIKALSCRVKQKGGEGGGCKFKIIIWCGNWEHSSVLTRAKIAIKLGDWIRRTSDDDSCDSSLNNRGRE